MRRERVVSGELDGDFAGKGGFKAAGNVNHGEFFEFAFGVRGEFTPLFVQVGVLGIGLRLNRDVLAGGHGKCARHHARDAGEHHAALSDTARGDANHEAGNRHDAIIRAEDGRAEPADMVGAVDLFQPCTDRLDASEVPRDGTFRLR